MKLATFALLAGSAAAFAPSKVAQTSTALQGSAFENEIGVINPTGFWDPAKLSYGASQETFDQYRLAELKHGRVCMCAVLGYVATETYHWPGYVASGIKFSDVPSGIAALDKVPILGWLQIVALVGAVETYGLFSTEVGYLDLSEEVLAERQTQELQHGRLAMLAFLELVRHDAQNLITPGFDGLDNLITGLPFIY